MGASVGIQIAKWLDPSIEADIKSKTPHMFSPLVTAMNSLAVYTLDSKRIQMESEKTEKSLKIISTSQDAPSLKVCKNLIGHWAFHSESIEDACFLLMDEDDRSKFPTSHQMRKKTFFKEAMRSKASFNPSLVYCMDFYDAYFDFNSFTVKLPGFSLNIFKYWDGQPMRYSATSKDRSVTFFVIQFEFVKKSDYPSIKILK
jgi:hypothetical protein